MSWYEWRDAVKKLMIAFALPLPSYQSIVVGYKMSGSRVKTAFPLPDSSVIPDELTV